MDRITAKEWICRKIHYQNKLRYKLIAGGVIIDLVFHRKCCKKNNTLERQIAFNKGRIYVNPLGIMTTYLPF